MRNISELMLERRIRPMPKKLLSSEGFFDFGGNADFVGEVEIVVDASFSRERFLLSVRPEKILIVAGTPAAGEWARELLRQIAGGAEDGKIPCFVAEDWPDLSVRGFMLDISRGRVPTETEFFKLLELLQKFRFNQLQLYTEHTFAFKNHEKVWRGASPVNAAFVRKLDAFCRSRGIELVPNLNSFGHVERWLKHEPYNAMAECPDGFYHDLAKERRPAGTFAPGTLSADFMGSLYEEFLPNFSSSFFNIGGDEPWELGLGKSAAECEKYGKRAVYVGHVMRLKSRAEKCGKKIMFWADVLLDGNADPLPRELLENSVPVVWGYEKDHPFDSQCSRIAAALSGVSGGDFLIAPGTSAWLSFTSRGGNAFENVGNACRAAARYGAAGILLTTWGDKGYFNPAVLNYPSIAVAGTLAWNLDDGNAFAAPAGTFWELLFKTVRLDDEISKKIPNRSLLHSVFFAKKEKARELLEGCDLNEFLTVARKAEDLREQAEELRSRNVSGQNPESEISLRELLLALAFEKAAAEKAADLLRGGNGSVAGLVPSLKKEFSQTWLLRDEPGGLDESLTYFDGLE